MLPVYFYINYVQRNYADNNNNNNNNRKNYKIKIQTWRYGITILADVLHIEWLMQCISA